MDIHDMWNYPVSSFLRSPTPLYTEREKETMIIPVFYFTGDRGEEDRAKRGEKGGDWGTRVRSEVRETRELG